MDLLEPQVPQIPTFVRVRWASLNKSAKKLVESWESILAAAAADLEVPRVCHTAVRACIDEDRLILCKLVFLREFTRKMLVHIKYFESTETRAHEVYARLVAIQNGFSPLFDAGEVELILTLGRCPADLREAMASLIRIASHAAQNDWLSKMDRNQDTETIQFYQMLAIFDPLQKAAFTFAPEEILEVLRPIHDSIFPVEVGYDPLAVNPLSSSYHSHEIHILSIARSSGLSSRGTWSTRHNCLGLLGCAKELSTSSRRSCARRSRLPDWLFRC